MEADQIIAQTKSWVKDIVIGLNFCPFANKEFINETIRYVVDDSDDFEINLTTFLTELHFLDKSEFETSLLIFPESYSDFQDYLDLVDTANDILLEFGYEGVYQIASFHPEYRFEHTKKEDAANYTNRSPYPMLHIIREASLEKAISSYENVDKIPENNEKLAREKGIKFFETILQNIKKQ
ncbi:MAG: DUF1415 domain-containing protein [Saprospiraceae bacterium]|nr:DUF1415 domain-containing protein [Saprospiraceae bacterium]